MFLARLLRYFTPGSNISKQEAYIYAAGIIVATAVNIFVLNPFWMCLMHIGMKIRVACCSLIYRKVRYPLACNVCVCMCMCMRACMRTCSCMCVIVNLNLMELNIDFVYEKTMQQILSMTYKVTANYKIY